MFYSILSLFGNYAVIVLFSFSHACAPLDHQKLNQSSTEQTTTPATETITSGEMRDEPPIAAPIKQTMLHQHSASQSIPVIKLEEFGLHKKTDCSVDLQHLIDSNESMVLDFGEQLNYSFRNVIIDNKGSILLKGNGSELKLAGDNANDARPSRLFQVVDPDSLNIEDGIIFNGNYLQVSGNQYLIEIVTTDLSKNKKIHIGAIKLQDATSGGIIVKNVREKAYYKSTGSKINFKSGAKNIIFDGGAYTNFGAGSAIQIRGSHKKVHIKNIFGSDPLGRSQKVIGVSAEVTIEDDLVGDVVIENCKTRYTSKASVFVQKTKEVSISNIEAEYAGTDTSGNINDLTIIKIDDLGIDNNCTIDNCVATNSADKKSNTFISLERSRGIGYTSGVKITNCKGDLDIRLAADGNHEVKDTELEGFILMQSGGNTVENVKILNGGVRIFGNKNKLLGSKLNNSIVHVVPKKTGILIEDVRWSAMNPKQQAIFIDNDPESPSEIRVVDCITPENMGIFTSGQVSRARNLKLSIQGGNIQLSDRGRK